MPAIMARDPFLLPVCSCGGPMNLASLEPHPTRTDQELKTYKSSCVTSPSIDPPTTSSLSIRDLCHLYSPLP